MRVSLPNPPWNAEVLAGSFGYAVPNAFVSFLQNLGEGCKTAEEVDDRLWEIAGWMLTGSEMRYQQTPPELFPMASNGSDGEHFGYVIHAPELFDPADDYPVAGICPMNGDGVQLVGGSTLEAFTNQMSFQFFYGDQEGWTSIQRHRWWPEVQDRLAALGVRPSRALWDRLEPYDPQSGIVRPFVPKGWRHASGSDGVGALAPSSLFDPHIVLTENGVCEDLDDAQAIDRWANRLITAGYPASALWLARETYWRMWSRGGDEVLDLCTTMRRIYQQLDRPKLASVIDDRIALLKRLG